VCVLADTAIDFLRLLAIGYDEISRDEHFASSPNVDCDADEPRVHPNRQFQEWVATTFSVDIPRTALEIIKHPAQMGDVDSPDVFCRWVERSDE